FQERFISGRRDFLRGTLEQFLVQPRRAREAFVHTAEHPLQGLPPFCIDAVAFLSCGEFSVNLLAPYRAAQNALSTLKRHPSLRCAACGLESSPLPGIARL